MYGNLKDIIWCPDLIPRDLEHYLLKLLKSRGYEHVIFYGEAGTKGTYCLDEVSARFFFWENDGISLPPPLAAGFERLLEHVGERNTAQTEQRVTTSAGSGSDVSDELDAMLDDSDDEYVPGALSDTNAESDVQPPSPPPAPAAASRPPKRVKYAYRGQTLDDFLLLVHPLMRDQNSHMAVILYNVLTTELRSSNLRDDLLSIWERPDNNNICLLLVPETNYNNAALETKVRQSGLESKFLRQIANSRECMPNPINCVSICQPGVDEIVYMLRYLAIIGTGKGNRIRLDYSEITKLAERIQYASGKRAGQSSYGIQLAREYMNEMYKRLTSYIDKKAEADTPLLLTPESIDEAWGITSDQGKALQELEKPGWEPALKKVKDALRIAEKMQNRMELRNATETPLRNPADWGVQRMEVSGDHVPEARVPVPNFVLIGSRGTGKTNIARLIGRILHEAGILKIGHTVETDREGLTSSYVAGVPKATMEKVREAEEGVLFIDEAQSLARKDGGENHSGTGVEVVSTLNAVLTNPNHHLSVVLAGYQEMEGVFDLDQGFRRRFGDNIIYIEDYPPELLTTILLNELRNRGYQIDPALTEERQASDTSYVPVNCMVERIFQERNKARFGNAGDMMTLASHAEGRAGDSVITQECFYGGNNGAITEEWFEPMNIGATAERLLAEINDRFVGMESVKEKIRLIGLELEDMAANNVSPEDIWLKPIILVGNPGTGKSTLAEYLPRLFFHYHLLGTSKPIIINASELADKYQGGSQEKVLEYIRQAQEVQGFLFVDEAHELLNESFDGKGAFKTFMAPTTDKKHPFLVCFAVYPDKLEDFLRLDPGAERRFQILQLEDYTGEQLYEIMRRIMERTGYSVTQSTDNLLRKVLDRVYYTRTNQTGNAGKVENILNDMHNLRRIRCSREGIPFDAPKSRVFVPEDIPAELRNGLNCDSPLEPEAQLQEILDDFSRNVVGMPGIRKELEDMVLEISEAIQRGDSADRIPLTPLVFSGNPGVGKSMLARTISRIYAHFQILHTEEPIILSAGDLASPYSGGAQEAIHKHIALAQQRKCCLYVDEAHQLLNRQIDGKGILQSFMAPTTDREHPFLACFAVYPKHLLEFLGLDPGAESRFRILELADYTGAELLEIMQLMMQKLDSSASEETLSLLRKHFEHVYNTRNERTGNGRYVEKLLQEMSRLRRKRCSDEGIPFTSPESRIFQPEDIPEKYRKHLTSTSFGTNLERLQHLKQRIEQERTGLVDLKNVLTNLVNRLIYQERFTSQATPVEPGHYFFKGNPGTGKTTAAEFFAHYLHELGLVQSPEPIIISASHLIGQYLGETGVKTRERLENSVGRVLVIDEAYALASDNDHANAYKQDAVSELVNFLDNEVFRRTTCVIFAGYEHDMDRLYEQNEGLRSRVHEIRFADFTPEQSMTVLVSLLEADGLTLSQEAAVVCEQQIRRMHTSPGFSNGRTIRRYCKMLGTILQNRCIQNIEEYTEDDPRTRTLYPDDIPELSVVYGELNLTGAL